MTTFYLLRHAHSQANLEGILAGRLPDIHLSPIGQKQAKEFSRNNLKIDLIISSPLERCLETITPYASKKGKRIIRDESFVEMNYGNWSGEKLKRLSLKRDWRKVKRKPSTFTFPNGESFLSAERRVKNGLRRLYRKYPNKNILIVSHGDIIKLAIIAILDLPLDRFQRILVDPASLSVVDVNKTGKSLMHLNVPISNLPTERKKLNDRRVLGGGSDV